MLKPKNIKGGILGALNNGFSNIEKELTRHREIKTTTVNKLIDFQERLESLNAKLHIYNYKLSEFSTKTHSGRELIKRVTNHINSIKMKLITFLSAWSINVNDDIGIIKPRIVKECLGDLLGEEERILRQSLKKLINKHESCYIDAVHCESFFLNCAKINSDGKKVIKHVLKKRTKESR